MKNVFRQIHLWLSIPVGLIFTIICFSGAMLVFETEITERLYPDRYFVSADGRAPLSIDVLVQKVSEGLTDSVSVTGITVSSDPERVYQVSLSKPRKASLAVNPYTGEVVSNNQRPAFFMTMFRLHRWLMGSSGLDGSFPLGKRIVGITTLIAVFILLSGIVIWIPKSRAGLKNRLRIATGKGARRFWFDLHVSGGFYVALVLLVLSLTGLTWSFDWYKNSFYQVFGAEIVQAAPAAKEGGKGRPNRDEKGMASRNWQQVLETLQAQNPDYNRIMVSERTASVSFDQFGNQRASDQYKYNPRTGEITEQTMYADQAKSGKLRGWIYSVHVGSWGGLLTRILTFLAALMGALLPLTGYYLWWKKHRKNNTRS